MRCKNCGWPNKPNEKVCIKCYTPLSATNDDAVLPVSNEDGFNKTVMEDDVFGNAPVAQHVSARQELPQEISQQCPKCGYPVRMGTEKCPNCNFQLNRVDVCPPPREIPQHAPASNRKPTRMNSGESRNQNRGTINPYMMNVETDPTFILKPLKRVNERHDFDEQEYEGKEVVLNRENTEPNNSSITSQQQAVITKVDGHWYIEDKSGQKTTFVQAAKRVELHDGDIILLGNRLFEFHE